MQGNLMRHMPPRADKIRTDAAAWNLWGWGWEGLNLFLSLGTKEFAKVR